MRNKIFLPLLLLGLITTGTAFAQEQTQLHLLTVTGNSEVRVAPDLVTVRLGVETEAQTAQTARDENAERVTRILEELRDLGIPEADMGTAVFQIQPIRRFEDPAMRGTPPIVGYRVSNIITVQTQTLDLAPQIIDRAVTAGANRIDSIAFTLRDDSGPRQNVLQQAAAEARQKAQALASELMIQLVRIHRVREAAVGIIPPPIVRAEAVGVPATPILPGEVTVNAKVTIEYLIGGA